MFFLPSFFTGLPPIPPPKPAHVVHKSSMHVPMWTSSASAANGSLSRAAQRTVPTSSSVTSSNIQNYKARSLASNLDCGNTGSSIHSFFTGGKSELSADPSFTLSDARTGDIKMGQDTFIEFVKENRGLGLSIIGGSDTPLV